MVNTTVEKATGVIRFHGCWMVQHEGLILAVSFSQTVAKRISALIEQHGLVDVPDSLDGVE